jgi:hypothetical protein
MSSSYNYPNVSTPHACLANLILVGWS